MNSSNEWHAQRHVLVVDNDPDCADSLAKVLHIALGIECDVAYDGKKALDLANSSPPSAVILDLQMPARNGFEVAASLLKAFPVRPPVLIAVTGNELLHERAVKDRRFVATMAKPPELGELVRLLQIQS